MSARARAKAQVRVRVRASARARARVRVRAKVLESDWAPETGSVQVPKGSAWV